MSSQNTLIATSLSVRSDSSCVSQTSGLCCMTLTPSPRTVHHRSCRNKNSKYLIGISSKVHAIISNLNKQLFVSPECHFCNVSYGYGRGLYTKHLHYHDEGGPDTPFANLSAIVRYTINATQDLLWVRLRRCNCIRGRLYYIRYGRRESRNNRSWLSWVLNR